MATGEITRVSTFYELPSNVIRNNGQNVGGESNANNFPNNTIAWVNNTGAGGYSNMPGTMAGHMWTCKPLSTHGFQLFIRHDGTQLYCRTVADNNWSAWKKINFS